MSFIRKRLRKIFFYEYSWDRRYEYVHHLDNCESTMYGDDRYCDCGAVDFLRSLDRMCGEK